MVSSLKVSTYPQRNLRLDWAPFTFLIIASLGYLLWKWLQPLDFWFWLSLGFTSVLLIWAISLEISDRSNDYSRIGNIAPILLVVSLSIPIIFSIVSIITAQPFEIIIGFRLGSLLATTISFLIFAVLIHRRFEPKKPIRTDVGVIIRLLIPKSISQNQWQNYIEQNFSLHGFKFKAGFPPIPGSVPPSMRRDQRLRRNRLVIATGTVEKTEYHTLTQNPHILAIWRDGPINELTEQVETLAGVGTLSHAAHIIGAKYIWNQGITGNGIVIGVVDGGVRACEIGDNMRRLANGSLDGWAPDDSVTEIGQPSHSCHGTAMAWTALGICRDAEILDIGVGRLDANDERDVLSSSINAFNALLGRSIPNEGPHVMLISWSLRHDDSSFHDLNSDPEHEFTLKILELASRGVIVCMAAGNCGEESDKCGEYCGIARSIWGTAGHPDIITVGACSTRLLLLPNSSVGPAMLALAMHQSVTKPEIIAPSRFLGYKRTALDGTSIANAVIAGVLGLLKARNPQLTHLDAKDLLINNSYQDGLSPPPDNMEWGYGIVNAKAAYLQLLIDMGITPPEQPVRDTLYSTTTDTSENWAPTGTSPCEIPQDPDPCPKEPSLAVSPCPCFLATAAFGSQLAPQVQYLRNYRDTVILQSTFRPAFERLLNRYYKLSPPIALKMHQSETLRTLIKYMIVYPIISIIKTLVSIRQTISRSK
jgi:hypothetical protein